MPLAKRNSFGVSANREKVVWIASGLPISRRSPGKKNVPGGAFSSRSAIGFVIVFEGICKVFYYFPYKDMHFVRILLIFLTQFSNSDRVSFQFSPFAIYLYS